MNLARDAVLYSEQLQDATGELADAATFLEGDVEDAVMEAECATHAAGKAMTGHMAPSVTRFVRPSWKMRPERFTGTAHKGQCPFTFWNEEQPNAQKSEHAADARGDPQSG